MAIGRRSTRVTAVSPWIWGGEGQARDLFPIPPPLFLTLQVIKFLFFRHWYITAALILSFTFYIIYDWPAPVAFIVFPLALLAAYTLTAMSYLWYKNPNVPIISRKDTDTHLQR